MPTAALARRWLPLAPLMLTLALAAPAWCAAQARDFVPEADATVIETLPARPQGAPRAAAGALDVRSAAASARHWIDASRKSAEPRYLGRAQAALAPWWDQPGAPPELAVLQATLLQRQHQFDAARKLLQSTLRRDPGQAQGWLTLAALDRLAGRYQDALAACEGVARSGPPLYAQACRMETLSLLGRHDEARAGLARLLDQPGAPAQQAWLLSLLGESEERAGRDREALAAYNASLRIDAEDGYTAVARADLLLRTGQPQPALDSLAGQPASLAVMLRRAQALKRLGREDWKPLAAELAAAFKEQLLRGDDPALEARERALMLLWLQDDAPRAFEAAQQNLSQQKEPIDWWIALQSARAAGRDAELARLQADLRRSGLADRRLAVGAAR